MKTVPALVLLAALALPGAAVAATAELPAPEAATLTIQGPAAGATGTAVAQLGDVNGDGRPDAAVAAPFADFLARPDAGIVAVVFGSPDARGAAVFESLPGFRIVGGRYYRAGYGVAAAGDVNGDRRDDILVSAPRHGISGYKTPGRVYVVFGSADVSPVDLSALGSRGFEIVGAEPWGSAAADSIAAAGDMDADGFDDVVVSEAVYSRGGRRHHGDAIVVYGSRRPGRVDLRRVGSRGFRLRGARRTALAPAGDVNGDRRPDLLVGAPSVKLPGRRFPANSAFVVFGARHRGTIDLRRLGSRGYRIGGLVAGAHHRPAVAGIGDLNRDGRDDALVVRDPGGVRDRRPEAVVVFGSRSPRLVDAGRLGSRGFRILGEPAMGRVSGLGPVAGLGDVNGDRRPDFALGSYTQAGRVFDHSAFVVHGATGATLALDDLGPAGLRLTGPAPGPDCGGRGVGASLAAGGDLDADGRPDVLLGAPALGGCSGQALLVPLG